MRRQVEGSVSYGQQVVRGWSGQVVKRSATRASLLFVLLLAVLVATSICVDAGAGQIALPLVVSRAGPTPVVHHGLVTDVFDGDTIEVQVDGLGLPLRVRYIGIDTPERGQCYWRNAKDRNEALVGSRQVRLEWDQSARDASLRYLCYVFVDGAMVNEALVREGYALAFTYPPDVHHADTFVALEEEARSEDRGMWGTCVPPKPPPPVTPSPDRSVSISYIQYCGADEYVRLTNRGPAKVDLSDWWIRSAYGGQEYIVAPDIALAPYESLYVHSGADAAERMPWHLVWRRGYVWNDTGDKVQLFDSADRIADEWEYTSPDGCDPEKTAQHARSLFEPSPAERAADEVGAHSERGTARPSGSKMGS